MNRLDRDSAFDEVEVVLNAMETEAEKGRGIKSTAYKTVQRILRASVPFADNVKSDLVTAMEKKNSPEEADTIIHHVKGEADLAIRNRARELAASTRLVVVVGNDCDYCIAPEVKWLLRPWGSRYIQYDIPACLDKAGLSRAQYQALGVVSHTDYSFNLPHLGIATNIKIIKAISDDKDTARAILQRYYNDPKVVAAYAAYTRDNLHLSRPHNRAAAEKVYIDCQETPLNPFEKFVRQLQETLNQMKVSRLKEKMEKASVLRRRTIKSKKDAARMAQGTEPAPVLQQKHGRRYNRFRSVTGAKPPSPPNPLPGPGATNDTNLPLGQFQHWQA
ncbi:hypothetical protein DFQ26_001522, partial [Actinomortierella ambigua]